ncbi:MAG: hypothetical protein HY862_08455 [Chloroflexi bacterium]|nr:hypothetical protein [Chloroflexota bacterium]
MFGRLSAPMPSNFIKKDFIAGGASHQRSLRLTTCTIGLFFFSLYIFSIGTPFYSSDGQVMYETARAIALKHTLATPPSDLPQTIIGHDGRTYSKYDPGLPLLSAPLVLAADQLGQSTQSNRYALAAIAVQLVPAAAMSIALAGLFHIASRLYSFRQAVIITFIAGLCTLVWPYARLYFAEAALTGCLTLAIAPLIHRISTHGVLFSSGVIGLALLTRASAIIYLPTLTYLIWKNSLPPRRWLNLGVFGCGPIIAVIALALHNYLRFHNLMTTGYEGESFHLFPIRGMFGLLFSPGKSIFLYSPPLVLSLIFWSRLRLKNATLAWALVILAGSALIFYGAWWAWHGGWVWGPRFLVPLVPLWCLPLGEIPTHPKWASLTLAVCVLGVVVQILGAFTDVTPHYAKVFAGANNPNDETRYAMVHYSPAQSPLVGAWQRAKLGIWENPAIFRLETTGLPGNWMRIIHISVIAMWLISSFGIVRQYKISVV